MKRSFFQAAVVSILLYGCTTWTLTKWPEKKLDGNYTRMLRAILNKSWRQHPTRHQLYGHLPSITKTTQARRTRHAGHCWRSREVFISEVLQWTSTYGRAKARRPARTYIQQLCEDTRCGPEDQPEAMNDREKWRVRIRDIRASSMTWWWWVITMKVEMQWERERERERESDCYDWHHVVTDIQIYSEPCVLCGIFDTGPVLNVGSTSGLKCLLTNCSPSDCIEWPQGSKNFCLNIIFWHPHIFPSDAIHFRCPLFTLRYGSNILFWNL